MKSIISNLFVVTFFVCLSVRDGLSIKCYDCKTNLQTGTDDCRDKFGNNSIRDCQSSVCSIFMKTLDSGERFIIRACGSDLNGTVIGAEGTSAADHGEHTEDRAHVSYRTCTTDLCNMWDLWDISHGHLIRRQRDTHIVYSSMMEVTSFFGISHNPHRKDGTEENKIQCYDCMTNMLDESDTKCRQNMKPINCYFGGCKIIKFAFAGDEVLFRTCDGPGFDKYTTMMPKGTDKKNGKLSRYGIELSWSTCTKDLCNWGVMNKYQTVTLVVSAMLSLSVYCIVL